METLFMTARCLRRSAPHSLGKLIEWKLDRTPHGIIDTVIHPPHSLGKLIEWKHHAIGLWSRSNGSPLAGETN